jgi:transaldolase/glucose-6-phosphate isomerase
VGTGRNHGHPVRVGADAGSKCRVILDETPDRLGPLADASAAALAELADRDAVARTWARDDTLWRDDPTEISDRLGWLTVVPDMAARLDDIAARCAGLASGVDNVLLAGMGGSSLFPEVVARSGAAAAAAAGGAPALHVLDTTAPAAIARLGDELPADRTLVVAASKSGATLETRSHLAWAWDRHPDPSRFAVITDPGSDLAGLAAERGFAGTFENPPDIGGRYSALSLFGLVPALLAGVDAAALVTSAQAMSDRLRAAPAANPAARLAATLAAGVRAGRDKLTIVTPDDQAAFGLWLEQLIAESTGKDGTGVVPVVGEPLGPADAYGADRVFVALGDDTYPAPLRALAEAGHPVVVLPFGGELGDLGGQVLLWELATALVGALLGIQPFDQPDVAAAKEATAKVLAGGPPGLDTTPLDDLLGQVRPGDYLAIQAFVDPSDEVVAGLEAARVALRDRLRAATTVGLGPRFLHSTGQLHKGGPDTGVFVQVVDADADQGGDADVPIPGAGYGFATLIQAQADGDLLTLRDRGRRAGRVRLDELLEVTP